MFKVQSSNSKNSEAEISESATIQNPKSKIQNLKVLLWDIDGTLMRSTRSGDWTKYFAPAMKEIYGDSGTIDGMNVSGMTDSQIVCEALKKEGISTAEVFSKFDAFAKILADKMKQHLAGQDEPYKLLPGVKQILEAVGDNPNFVNALLTGNFTGGAKIKLNYFDLWKYFENQPNTFGETSRDRRELARCAAQNVQEFLRMKVAPEQFIVIGDTPNDIKCARFIGAKMISVASGRNHSVLELAEYKPDAVLDDLSDTNKVLRLLETL